jgi:hypothetical protein
VAEIDPTTWGPLVSLATGRPVAVTEEVSQADGQLLSELSLVNYDVARYIFERCGVEGYRLGGVSIEEELGLADCLVAAGEAVRARARHRAAQEAEQGGED